MTKHFTYGSVLAVTTTTAETNIGQIVNISGPGSDFDDLDTTTLDSSSNFRTYTPGLANPGELTFTLLYAPTTLSHKRLMYYHNNRSAKTFTVYIGSTAGTATSFSAYVKGFNREIELAGILQGEVTLKVSGKPGWTS